MLTFSSARFDRVTTKMQTSLVRFDRVSTKLLTFREVRDHVKKTCILSWKVQKRTLKRLGKKKKKKMSHVKIIYSGKGKDTF